MCVCLQKKQLTGGGGTLGSREDEGLEVEVEGEVQWMCEIGLGMPLQLVSAL